MVEHCIDTGGAKPVRTSPRRFPYSLRSELEEELRKLLQIKCIEPANSPYASSLVPVRKKDGSIRVCVDYRALNKDTVPDRYPIPRIVDVVDVIGRRKGKVFSSLDLMKGYHQVRIASGRQLSLCHMGLFQYRHMHFGLTNAPATFQRLMNQLFQGGEWDFVFIYLDDILIVSLSVEEHRSHLNKVLQRLDDAGLCLKLSKCHFVKRQIDYLGYTVSPEGVLPNSIKVEAVQNVPQPRCSKSIKQFLGLINFYRHHIPKLAVIARPLTALTRRDKKTRGPVVFEWTTECEASFCKLKELLITAPVLHPLICSRSFIYGLMHASWGLELCWNRRGKTDTDTQSLL